MVAGSCIGDLLRSKLPTDLMELKLTGIFTSTLVMLQKKFQPGLRTFYFMKVVTGSRPTSSIGDLTGSKISNLTD